MVSSDQTIIKKIQHDVLSLIDKYCQITSGFTQNIIENISEITWKHALDDLFALTERDPAAGNDSSYVYSSYNSYKAVLYYRFSNAIYYCSDIKKDIRKLISKQIQEFVKNETTIEIHPAAKIGKRFVIDHGVNVVIGETCIIGEDCYMLQCVVLGAISIGKGKEGQRHPIIGNGVEIGGFVVIVGPIYIGDNVFISPHCLIRDDIPSNSKVVIINQLQISSSKNQKKIIIYGIIPKGKNRVVILGEGFINPKIEIFTEDPGKNYPITFEIINYTDNEIEIKVLFQKNDFEIPNQLKLKLIIDENFVIINQAFALEKIFKNISSN